jgi:class 3 adenylate cyclase
MALKDDLKAQVDAIFCTNWKQRDGLVVPEDTSVKLGNDAVNIEGTVLYADLDESTKMVDTKKPTFAAEVYKSFLHTAAKIISAEGGTIVAYDGDRVMAIFIGNSKSTAAVRTGLKINWATKNIVQPSMKAVYKNTDFIVKHVVGIDTCKLFVAKTGIRGANDLVWVGRAANWAAKLCTLSEAPTWITKAVYDMVADEAKYSKGANMWQQRSWTPMNNATIYSSTYWWSL